MNTFSPARRSGAPSPRLSFALVVLLASLAACAGDPATAGRERSRKQGKRGKAPAETSCRAAAPVDPDLAAGLEVHLAGKSAEAIPRLAAWAAKPGAETDPAAGRGFYSLAFALRGRGQYDQAQAVSDRALAALTATLAERPTLETYYYLASLHESRRETAAQLETTKAGLTALKEGKLCPKPDGDDLFRAARLAGFAGWQAEQAEFLARAVKEYGAGRGSLVAYRALVHTEVAESARRAGDAARWEAGLRAAVAIDPTIPGVHRGLGLALLSKGDLQGAADYWRANWRAERDNGNGLVYCIPVLDDILRWTKASGDAGRITNLAEFTIPALEQNASLEGQRVMQIDAARAAAEGGILPAEQEAERDLAEYRMNQFLLEYLRRGKDIQEFALEKGLLGAIHHRGLPRPTR